MSEIYTHKGGIPLLAEKVYGLLELPVTSQLYSISLTGEKIKLFWGDVGFEKMIHELRSNLSSNVL